MKRFELTQEQCHTFSMNALFDNFAKAMGYKDVSALRYECTRILVSKAVQNEFFAAAKEVGAPEYAIGMAWLLWGPKATINDDERFLIEPQEGFIIENEKEETVV